MFPTLSHLIFGYIPLFFVFFAFFTGFVQFYLFLYFARQITYVAMPFFCTVLSTVFLQSRRKALLSPISLISVMFSEYT